MNTFDFNSREIEKINVLGSNLFVVDNFYKNPQEVLSIITTQPTKKWKEWDTPTYNGVYFYDHRHDFYCEHSKIYNDFFENLTGQKIAQPGQIVTNCIQFFDRNFNNYNDNYWAPHTDLGYTALIYLNKDTCEGTNFYTQIDEDLWNTPEHFEPWRTKKKYKIEYTVEAKFNRMILFDGKILCHGMAVDSDLFFSKTRINQAVFLK